MDVRPASANRLKADLFVSIHLNANTNHAVSGAEVYFPRESVVAPDAHWPPYLTSTELGMPYSLPQSAIGRGLSSC